jgi:hypothetical protein
LIGRRICNPKSRDADYVTKIPVLDDARDFLRAMMVARSLRGIMVDFSGSK